MVGLYTLMFQLQFGTMILAGAVATVLSLSDAANASTFQIFGGTTENLPGTFNPATNPDGLGTSTPITIFGAANSFSGGLSVTPGNANILFTYYGFEAGHTDKTFSFAYSLSPLFTTGSSAPNSSVLITNPGGAGASLVGISFYDQNSFIGLATNGGLIVTPTHIAFSVTSDGQTAYAFFDDAAGGRTDHDYDDMIVKLTFAASVGEEAAATPLPAALPLFAAGIGALGLLGWRRKRRGELAGG